MKIENIKPGQEFTSFTTTRNKNGERFKLIEFKNDGAIVSKYIATKKTFAKTYQWFSLNTEVVI